MYNIRWFSLELLWSKQPSYSFGKATHVEDRLPKEEMVIVYPTVFGEAIPSAYLQKWYGCQSTESNMQVFTIHNIL